MSLFWKGERKLTKFWWNSNLFHYEITASKKLDLKRSYFFEIFSLPETFIFHTCKTRGMRVLNDSTILSERIKEDYGTKRVLNKHNEKSFQKKVSGNFSQGS